MALLLVLLTLAQAPTPGITGSPEGAAILSIEDRRAPTAHDLAVLVEATRSTQPFIQHAAIRALGRLERRDVVTNLLPLLVSGNAETRAQAAFAIAQAMRGDRLPLDPAGTQVDGVLAALTGAIGVEREAAAMDGLARSIARLPFERAEQVQRVDRQLRGILTGSRQLSVPRSASGESPFAAAASGLELLARLHGKLSPLSDETIEALRSLASGQGRVAGALDAARRARLEALRALIAARGLDADTLRVNLSFADSDMVRMLATQALSGAGSPIVGTDRRDYLRTALDDGSYLVRLEALRGYLRHYAKTDGCLPVMPMLSDASEHVTLSAIDALGTACDGEEVVNRLVAEARTPPETGSWRRESHALVALARRSPSHLEIPLVTHSRHNRWQVRMYAARAAAVADEVETLQRLAHDDHDNVREATLAALKRLRGDGAEPQFLAALGRDDYQLLRTAARELNGITPTPALTTALVDALVRVTARRHDTSRDTRLALLERLRTFGSERNRERLLPLLRDFDSEVAAAAATTLNAWTGEAFSIDPSPLARPPLPSAAELAIASGNAARLVMESGKEIPVVLDTVNAPIVSVRFLRLANANYYDDLTFHRVVSNFVLQGGSPGANEYAGDGPYLRDEISLRSHRRGTVGLSTRGRDTGDAQFFINLVDNPRLDFEYTVFGHVPDRYIDRIDEIQEGDRIVDIRWGPPPGFRLPGFAPRTPHPGIDFMMNACIMNACRSSPPTRSSR
jgi:cyclophilin family peptidyl-prolyl cis-trans isomerase/HEAT repeat protein